MISHHLVVSVGTGPDHRIQSEHLLHEVQNQNMLQIASDVTECICLWTAGFTLSTKENRVESAI